MPDLVLRSFQCKVHPVPHTCSRRKEVVKCVPQGEGLVGAGSHGTSTWDEEVVGDTLKLKCRPQTGGDRS